MGLRFCGCQHTRRQKAAAADDDRRVHEDVSGDSCGAAPEQYDLIETLADLMLVHGIPEHIRSDNGPEFIAARLRKWLVAVGAKTLYIEPGSPWENEYCDSFNGKLQDECLKGVIFYSLKEAQVMIERWRVHYNTVRPHSSLGYRPSAPQTILPKEMGYGDMENAARFPHLHPPDYDYGVGAKKTLH